MRVISESRLVSVLSGLPGTPRVVAGGNFATPWRALAALDTALPEYRLFMLNAQPGVPDREGVTLESPFVGSGMRGRANLRYFPSRLSRVPYLLAQALPPDIVLVHTTLRRNGTLSLGTEVNILPAAIEQVRSRGGLVIAQMNRRMPYTYGDAVLDESEVDYAIEVDEPLASPAHRPATEVSQAIGDRVAHLVPEAATLQLGIGQVPDAVLAALLSRRGLSVWSEMFSDGVLTLEKAGALDDRVPITASFVFGSSELYDWVDRNERVRLLRTEKTNDPALISRQSSLTSVNGALQVDLYAQANAARVRGLIYSGFGGQTDFIVGALHSPGGRAIIALPSWHPKADVSTVVPRLAGPVTSFQHSFIVSEQGAATIWGNDAATQAQQLLDNVAHPDARDALREAGRHLGFPLR
ncbi:4-hydroxybutyrate CoA-transferase [Sphaerisporangium melleum]|uniref:4-hydroxybutyrate CoA-transferase n=1 Tax=Sphaerisporangium melleum TaxID=321316 RepID=A0A917RHF2_9ACTN|nr:acetyl-CoA hydrolase/transferase C-terminal domain-containing protein [Sphaerisporangium melleum]GGL07317.1 4-hydroxybutyrate CoA-transferase [Sphaerisporangium melleum]GII68706.1 4-hydroxybutyrate CoA-transferase [Sphaerisporangium melleum]